MSSSFDVLVVGSGVAGLRAAQILERAGREVTMIEASGEVGGRIRSQRIDGYVVDEGFQLLNTAYPELRAAGITTDLDLRNFPSSVVLRDAGRDLVLAHPLREPGALPASLWAYWRDAPNLLRFGNLLRRVGWTAAPNFLTAPDVSTLEGLLASGLDEGFINAVVRPFMQGVLLENELSTSWRYSQLVLRSFVRGRAAVPAGGMQALPLALRSSLRTTQFRFNEGVRAVQRGSVTTDLGELRARDIVVAVDQNSAAVLRGESPQPQRAVTTWWFDTPQLGEGRLRLDRDGGFLANALAMSVAAPSYAPVGRTLIAASAVGVHASSEERRAAEDVARLYGLTVRDVSLITTTVVESALPVRSPGAIGPGAQAVDGVIYAGDYLETPSIQGALVSGRKAARQLLQS